MPRGLSQVQLADEALLCGNCCVWGLPGAAQPGRPEPVGPPSKQVAGASGPEHEDLGDYSQSPERRGKNLGPWPEKALDGVYSTSLPQSQGS